MAHPVAAAAVSAAKASVLAATSATKDSLYHKGANIGILAAKAIEQSGEHGSVFALGEHIDVDLITWMIVGLIVFTVIFEVSLHHLEHYLSSNHVYEECLGKVFKELTIMGFISFILLLIHEFVKIPFHEHIVFEFAHIWIFFVALVFIIHSIIFMGSLSSAEKKFKVWDNTKHDGDVMEEPSIKAMIFGTDEKQAIVNYHVAKEIFREHNKVSETFDFRKYLSDFCGDTIVELLDTTELTWGLLIVLFLLNLGRNHLVDYMNHTKEDPAAEMNAADTASQKGAASLLALSGVTHATHISFFSLSVHQAEALLGTHKRSLWTFMIFGWSILIFNFSSLVVLRNITGKLLYAGRFHVGRPNGEEPDEHANSLAHDESKMRSYLPCGKMKVFRVILELVVIVQCFYLGLLMLLNGRAAYSHFPPPYGLLFLLVMFVPIVINLFVCFPAQIKAIAFLSAITEVDAHIKHEVEEYQHTMLIDFQHKVKSWLKTDGKSPQAGAAEIYNSAKNDEGVCEDHALHHVLVSEGIKFKPDQFFSVFKQFDQDASGSVDEGEILSMITASASSAGDDEEAPAKHH